MHFAMYDLINLTSSFPFASCIEIAIGRTLIPRYFRSIFEGGVSDLSFHLKHSKESFHNTTITLDCEQCSMITSHGKMPYGKVRHDCSTIAATVCLFLQTTFARILTSSCCSCIVCYWCLSHVSLAYIDFVVMVAAQSSLFLTSFCNSAVATLLCSAVF